MDLRVLLYTLAASVLTGMAFGLVPALQTSRPDLNQSLKEGGRGAAGGLRSHNRSLLVVVEIALSLILLIGAGLMVQSFRHLQDVNPGFKAENLLSLQISLPLTKYPLSRPHQVRAFFQELIERVETLPGVKSVCTTSALPLSGQGMGRWISFEDRPAPHSMENVPVVQYSQVSWNYFQTLGTPLVKGRLFTEADDGRSLGVAIINEALARRFWPGEDPIGKRIRMGPPENLVTPDLLRTLPPGFTVPSPTVVGVVKNIKHYSLSEQTPPEIYVPYLQTTFETWRALSVIVRTGADLSGLASAIRSEVWAIDKDQPVANITTLERLLADSTSQPGFNTVLLAIFAALALVLATAGIYGVISYSVTQRTHEIGVRMALGAQKYDICKLMVGQGMILTLIGVGAGLIGASALTRLMGSLLYGVTATDPTTFVGVSVLLAVVALLACYIPARRATKVDPMVALRYE